MLHGTRQRSLASPAVARQVLAAGLRSLLDGNLAAITYSHELTASVNSSMFLVMCVAFR